VVEEENGSEEDDRLLTKDEADLQEIDLEEVLEGGGHFPDEPRPEPEPESEPEIEPELKPKPRSRAKRAPAEAADAPARDPELEPAARPVRKPARKPAEPKLDTKEEIAKLIAVLEEKERRATGRLDEAPASAPVPPPLAPPESVPPVIERKPGLDAAWEELLRKPPTVDVEGDKIEIRRVPDTSSETDFRAAERRLEKPFRPEAGEAAEEEERVLEPAASMVPGDTMDFQNEVLGRTPLVIPVPASAPLPAEPTRMGIPERITREEIFEDRDENETPPESVFDDLRLRPSPPTPSTAELLERGPSGPRRRLGFFRKLAALLFDAVFVAAVWTLAMWLAGKLMGLGLPELLRTSPLGSAILLAVLLASYFFLFLFFLGETLGDRMASPKS